VSGSAGRYLLNRNLIVLYCGRFMLAGLDRHHSTDSCCYKQNCHDVGLRKRHLEYHMWDCSCCILLYGFLYCTVLLWAVLTDVRWKLAATHFNIIRIHHCGIMLQTDPERSTLCRMPTSNTAKITDSGQQVALLTDFAREVPTLYILD